MKLSQLQGKSDSRDWAPWPRLLINQFRLDSSFSSPGRRRTNGECRWVGTAAAGSYPKEKTIPGVWLMAKFLRRLTQTAAPLTCSSSPTRRRLNPRPLIKARARGRKEWLLMSLELHCKKYSSCGSVYLSVSDVTVSLLLLDCTTNETKWLHEMRELLDLFSE